MMLSTRLVRMIEQHSEEIIRQMLEAVRSDPHLPRMRQLPDSLLTSRYEHVCRRLGHWLEVNNESELSRHFEQLGRERFEEEIPLHEVVHCAQVLKSKLAAYAREHCFEQTAFDLYTEVELERLLSAFFDRIVYYLVRGYEQACLDAEATSQAHGVRVHHG